MLAHFNLRYDFDRDGIDVFSHWDAVLLSVVVCSTLMHITLSQSPIARELTKITLNIRNSFLLLACSFEREISRAHIICQPSVFSAEKWSRCVTLQVRRFEEKVVRPLTAYGTSCRQAKVSALKQDNPFIAMGNIILLVSKYCKSYGESDTLSKFHMFVSFSIFNRMPIILVCSTCILVNILAFCCCSFWVALRR